MVDEINGEKKGLVLSKKKEMKRDKIEEKYFGLNKINLNLFFFYN